MTYRTRSLTLNLELRRTFRWVFMVANVHNLILGAYFLKYYSPVVDMGHKPLMDTRTNLSVQGIISSSRHPASLFSRNSQAMISWQFCLNFLPSPSYPFKGRRCKNSSHKSELQYQSALPLLPSSNCVFHSNWIGLLSPNSSAVRSCQRF